MKALVKWYMYNTGMVAAAKRCPHPVSCPRNYVADAVHFIGMMFTAVVFVSLLVVITYLS